MAEAAAVRVERQRAAERATAAEQGLEAAKVRQEETEARLRTSLANTEAVLQEALAALESEWATLERAQKALEAEQRAQSEVDQEVLVLRGQVMGMEEANARLHEQVTQQAEGLSILEKSHLGTYLFYFSSCWFLPLACF